MGLKISGAGNNSEVRVDSDGFLRTRPRNEVEDGRRYAVVGVTETLTDAAKTPVMYLFNKSLKTLDVLKIRVSSGPSTGGSGAGKVEIAYNDNNDFTSTAAMSIRNCNRGAGEELSGHITANTGDTGDTITATGEANVGPHSLNQNSNVENTDKVILKPGHGLVVYVTAPASNTGMTVDIAAYLEIGEDD